MEKREECWDIRVLQIVTLRVCFDREVTKEEAIELFQNNEYEDITDERDHEIQEILGAE